MRRNEVATILLVAAGVISLISVERRRVSDEGAQREASSSSRCDRPQTFEQSSMPWRLYDAFVSKGVATFIAQYEGGCAEMEAVLERLGREAGFANASEWLNSARPNKPGGCESCAMSAFEKTNMPRFAEARRAMVPTKRLVCIFGSRRVQARQIDETFHRAMSTLVFECDLPHGDEARVDAIEEEAGLQRRHGRVELCDVTSSKARVDVAACAWTSADKFFADRDGNRKKQSIDGVTEWLAAHLAFGVGYFMIFDDDARWRDPKDSALWPAVGPLVAAGKASLVAWPWRACGAKGDGPWVEFEKGRQRRALSLQTFWGRPAQYAAQNACHRRLRHRADWIAHLDVDEFAIPATNDEKLISSLRAVQNRSRKAVVASVALPHIFYGVCPNSTINRSRASFLSRQCAGKAQPSRTKQIARSDAVDFVLDHSIKVKRGKVVTADALTEARLIHARAGYGFEGPATARFATVQSEEVVPAIQRQNFDAHILPRLQQLDCANASKANVCGVPPGKHRFDHFDDAAPRSERQDAFCWCRDTSLGDHWSRRIELARQQLLF